MLHWMLCTSLSHCSWVNLCAKYSFVWWPVTIPLPLNYIPEVFRGVQVWRLDWLWQGVDLVVLHPRLDWPGWVAWSTVLLENPVLRDRDNFQSRRKEAFLQSNIVHGLICASVSILTLLKPPDHHQSSTRFHSSYERQSHLRFSKCPSNHLVLKCFVYQ